MSTRWGRLPLPSSGLVAGALLGMACPLVPSPSLRGLVWGLDGIALIIATALLAIDHLNSGQMVTRHISPELGSQGGT